MRPQLKRKLLKFRSFLKPILIIGVSVILLSLIFAVIIPVSRFAKKNNISKEFLTSLISGKDIPLKSINGRTDVVILGMSGGNHKGTDLTDTIIYLSVNFSQKSALMLSIPRDTWIPSMKAKINSAYHYGEKKKEGGGLTLTKSAVSEVTGRPISYAFLIDFSGFTKMIDLVGGIDVEVEAAFEDDKYPIPGKENDLCNDDPLFLCRYEKISFEKGWQHMDGDRALKFVRSRNAKGDEGTDFARSQRQQKVIIALKDKIISTLDFRNTERIKQLFDAFNTSVKTDMTLSEQILFFKFFLDLPEESIKRLALYKNGNSKSDIKNNNNENSLLYNPPTWKYDGLWVLIPKAEDFSNIHDYVACNFEKTDCLLKDFQK